MKTRHYLLALGALTVPAAVAAQASWPMPAPPPVPMQAPVPMPAPPRAAVDEPWMARPAPAATGQPWQSPIAEPNKGPALEPIDLPPAIEQGVDMIYIDEELVPRAVHDNSAPDMSFAAWSGAPVDFL